MRKELNITIGDHTMTSHIQVNDSVSLFHTEDGKPLTTNEVRAEIIALFIELSKENPNHCPLNQYIAKKRPCFIGIGEASKGHVNPVFNYVAITHLQCELTMKMRAHKIGCNFAKKVEKSC